MGKVSAQRESLLCRSCSSLLGRDQHIPVGQQFDAHARWRWDRRKHKDGHAASNEKGSPKRAIRKFQGAKNKQKYPPIFGSTSDQMYHYSAIMQRLLAFSYATSHRDRAFGRKANRRNTLEKKTRPSSPRCSFDGFIGCRRRNSHSDKRGRGRTTVPHHHLSSRRCASRQRSAILQGA